MKFCVSEADFSEKNLLPQKVGKWTENGRKQGFLNLLKIWSLILTEFDL